MTKVFYGPFLPIWHCINLSFWYLDAVCAEAIRVLFMWIPWAFNMLRLLDDIPDIKKVDVSR
jgi:hypothetical protein